VAEGIENQDQVDRLGQLACDYGQGFFIGKPITAKQVNDALAGLPYASSSGRTAITWLWERALKDPPPVPNVKRVTAVDIEESRAAAEPAMVDEAVPETPPDPVNTAPETGQAPLAPRKTKPAMATAVVGNAPEPKPKKKRKRSSSAKTPAG
jgi:hypothetical protein